MAILGASGFVGSWLARTLASAGVRELLPLSSRGCDLENRTQARAVLGDLPEGTAVLLCSALRRERSDTWTGFWRNVAIVRNALEALDGRSLHSLVYLSSICVYGSAPAGSVIDEDVPAAPDDYFALAKRTGEELLRMRPDGTFPATTLRLPCVYGAGDGGQSSVGRIANELRARGRVRLADHGRARRDFLFVEDLCAVVETLLRAPYDGVLNVVSGESASIRDVAALVAGALGVPLEIETDPAGVPDSDLVCDPTRVRTHCPEVRWTPLAEGVARYLHDTVA